VNLKARERERERQRKEEREISAGSPVLAAISDVDAAIIRTAISHVIPLGLIAR